MAVWKYADDLVTLAGRRSEVYLKIERLLLIRDLMGEWTPDHRLEYERLCGDERTLLERMETMAPDTHADIRL